MTEILTLREVASLLKVHPNTVYRLARSGRLPGFKTGTDWRFDRTAVESWISARSRPGAPAASPPTKPGEVIDVLYWMLGQGFSLSVSSAELAMLLDWTPREVKRAVDALARSGDVTVDGGSVALTPDGIARARRRVGERVRPPSGHESVRTFAERFTRGA